MRVTFSHRIIGGFLIMAVLSILIGYFAFVTTKYLQRVSRAIMKENVSSLKAAEELELALLNQKGLVSNYFLDDNPIWLKTLEDKKKDFEIWFKNAQDAALTQQEKAILKDIRSLYKKYNNHRNKAIRLYQQGGLTEAKKILANDMKNSIDQLYEKCEDLILTNELLITEAEASSRKNVFWMTILIWTTIAVTLLLGIGMGFLTARRINEQLVRSARLSSLGQLSANIAHEIRNPLTSIKMRLYTLGRELKDTAKSKEDVDVISEDINSMEKIVNNFLDFARPPEPHLQKGDISQILKAAINLLLPKASTQNIEIKKNLADTLPEIELDKEQIRQAILNIMLNAIEALPQGGILEISTSTKKTGRRSKDIIEIKFQDTGQGISPLIKKKLFEPFFTTKERGTGLGLFITNRIIQAHRGIINIDSQPGEGTVVTIGLPIH